MKFSELKLEPDLLKAAAEMGFSEATPVQEKSIPLIQAGRDVMAQSETGSGKTAAFGLPILEKLTRGERTQCLILTPTRELAEQIGNELRKFSRYRRAAITTVYGGVSISPQIERLRHAEIVVATPGRLLDHLGRRTIDLSRVRFLVLDEADKMFEMGFVDDVRRIIEQTPGTRQTMLFSATLSEEVLELAQEYLRNPESVKARLYVDTKLLRQEYYDVPGRDKFSLLLHLLNQEAPRLAMVFCATRTNTDIVARNLQRNGVKAMPIHGGHSQNRRTGIMKAFHAGDVHVLVATDVAARGLDIKGVTHIINYDIPKTSKEYVHRIGRTARAGKSGKAISLLSERDYDNFQSVLQDRSLPIERKELPPFPRVPFAVRSREEGYRPQRGGFRGYGGRREGERSDGPRKGGYRPQRGGFRGQGERREDERSGYRGTRREGGRGGHRERSDGWNPYLGTPRPGYRHRGRAQQRR